MSNVSKTTESLIGHNEQFEKQSLEIFSFFKK